MKRRPPHRDPIGRSHPITPNRPLSNIPLGAAARQGGKHVTLCAETGQAQATGDEADERETGEYSHACESNVPRTIATRRSCESPRGCGGGRPCPPVLSVAWSDLQLAATDRQTFALSLRNRPR